MILGDLKITPIIRDLAPVALDSLKNQLPGRKQAETVQPVKTSPFSGIPTSLIVSGVLGVGVLGIILMTRR